MRAVLDPNVIISAALSPTGAPALVIRAWLDGEFELVVSRLLLEELRRAMKYPKLRDRISPADAGELLDLLLSAAETHDDPSSPPPVRSPDPGDDYLIALAATADAMLVSVDGHLLGLAATIPVLSPAAFLDQLNAQT